MTANNSLKEKDLSLEDESYTNLISLQFKFNKLKDKISFKNMFSIDYLKTIHYNLFKDRSYYMPGELRNLNIQPMRRRSIETSDIDYLVTYNDKVSNEKDIDNEIKRLLESNIDILSNKTKTIDGNSESNKINENDTNLSKDDVSRLLVKIYSKLDQMHPFSDGNSRTLREFVRQVALKLGFNIDYSIIANSQIQRDNLYLARDLEVLKLTNPNILDKEYLLENGTRSDFEIYESLKLIESELNNREVTFEKIFAQTLTKRGCKAKYEYEREDEQENKLGNRYNSQCYRS